MAVGHRVMSLRAVRCYAMLGAGGWCARNAPRCRRAAAAAATSLGELILFRALSHGLPKLKATPSSFAVHPQLVCYTHITVLSEEGAIKADLCELHNRRTVRFMLERKKRTKRVQLVTDPDLLDEIDDWRVQLRPVPSRNEAICWRLVKRKTRGRGAGLGKVIYTQKNEGRERQVTCE
jgi:hypothetical protein